MEKLGESSKDEAINIEEEGSLLVPECAVCLQLCIHPARLPCNHVFCFLCVKGVANQSKRCPMCRQEIPTDFLERPLLIEIEENKKEEIPQEEYQWFYEGRNGWWQYDHRTSLELETAFKEGKPTCELLIAGFLYVADFRSMLQMRRNDHSRRRRIKRDLPDVPKIGIAGLRLSPQEEEQSVREIRGAETPASNETSDENCVFDLTSGVGDGMNTPVPPSNTPQTPAGGSASGDATPSMGRSDYRSDSLHQINHGGPRFKHRRSHRLPRSLPGIGACMQVVKATNEDTVIIRNGSNYYVFN